MSFSSSFLGVCVWRLQWSRLISLLERLLESLWNNVIVSVRVKQIVDKLPMEGKSHFMASQRFPSKEQT